MYPFKNWPCVTFCPWKKVWVNALTDPKQQKWNNIQIQSRSVNRYENFYGYYTSNYIKQVIH